MAGVFFLEKLGITEILVTLYPAVPELVLLAGIFIVISYAVFFEKLQKRLNINLAAWFSQALLFFVILTTIYKWNFGTDIKNVSNPILSEVTFSGLFINDGYTSITKLFMLAISLLFLTIAAQNKKRYLTEEKIICILFFTWGALITISYGDFMLLFLGLEIISISIAFILKMDKNLPTNIPLKVFSTHCIGTGFLLAGIAILYATYGSTNCTTITTKILLKNGNLDNFSSVLSMPWLAVIFIVWGVFTKMMFCPFHGINVEVSEKSGWSSFLFINIFLKFVCLIILIKFFVIFNLEKFMVLLFVVGLVMAVVGVFNSINKTNIKGLLACNSLGNTGLIFICFSQAYINLIPSLLFFLAMQIIFIMAFWGIIVYVNNYGRKIVTLNDFRFVVEESPVAAFLFCVYIFCIFNPPPFPGFLPIIILTKNLALEGAYRTIVLLLILKIISIGNSFRMIKRLFFMENQELLSSNTLKKPKQFTKVSLVVWGLSVLVLVLCARPNSVVNFLTLGELSLRYYGDLGSSTSKLADAM